MEKNEILTIKGASKTFDNFIACRQIDLTIDEGEFFFILGPSGCGKSTLLRLLSGLLTPDSGELFLRETLLNPIPPYLRDVNTVFQNYALFPHMSVFDNVAFGLRMKNVLKDEIDQRVNEMLQLVQLKGFEKRKPGQMSGGQQQRVALARALVNHPAVLLLDEPLSALDVKLRKQMQLELKHLQRKLGTTFVYVTHDQEEALTMGDRIAVMNKGQIEQIGTPDEVYNHPKTRFVADFIGESNFFEGAARVQSGRITLPLNELQQIQAVNTNGHSDYAKLVLMVRPEKIKLLHDAPPTDTLHNQLVGEIRESIYLGTMHHYLIQVGENALVKVMEQHYHDQANYHSGDRVTLSWDVQHTVVLKS